MDIALHQDVHTTRKENMKKFLILTLILTATKALAFDGYVSPETYAVNEADMVNYMPKVEKIEKQDDKEAYKERLSYRFAKWWVDQRYKREEIHHGAKHEIKVKAREKYEKQIEEK